MNGITFVVMNTKLQSFSLY